jgi:hypothetical protein
MTGVLQPTIRFDDFQRISRGHQNLCEQRIRIERDRCEQLVELFGLKIGGASGLVAGTSAGGVGNRVSPAELGAGSWVSVAGTGASGADGDPPAPDIDAWSGCAQTTEDTNNATVRMLTVGTSIFHTHDGRFPHPLPPSRQSTTSYHAIQLGLGPSAKTIFKLFDGSNLPGWRAATSTVRDQETRPRRTWRTVQIDAPHGVRRDDTSEEPDALAERIYQALRCLGVDRVWGIDRLANLATSHRPLRRRFDQLATNQRPGC